MNNPAVTVIGGGLAGVESARQLSKRGIAVELWEMKPVRFSPAHKSEALAELVCSNSLKAIRAGSAAGLLKQEMLRLGSVCVEAALKCAVPAGGALAVDREAFSALITETIHRDPLITLKRGEVTQIPGGYVIVAAGPLASEALSRSISELCGEGLHFYDAAAPIVSFESIDMSRAFTASRYGRGEDDYINCPMNKEEYEVFHDALVSGRRAALHSFDERREVYEGCMPIEVMAGRGVDTVRYGPMKPVGLRDPATGHRPWAVLQLRKENAAGTMYNLVGCQTNLAFSEQKRIFSMIPALKNASFIRYGVMHRNTFIDSPRLLCPDFSFRQRPQLYFAGQITGVEGYMESAASGIMAGLNAAMRLEGRPPVVLPETTMIGALSRYISDKSVKSFQPMGASFGLLPPIEPRIKDKAERGEALAERSLTALEKMMKEGGVNNDPT